MEKTIDRLVDSIGSETFVKYFKGLSDLNNEKISTCSIDDNFCSYWLFYYGHGQ